MFLFYFPLKLSNLFALPPQKVKYSSVFCSFYELIFIFLLNIDQFGFCDLDFWTNILSVRFLHFALISYCRQITLFCFWTLNLMNFIVLFCLQILIFLELLHVSDGLLLYFCLLDEEVTFSLLFC